MKSLLSAFNEMSFGHYHGSNGTCLLATSMTPLKLKIEGRFSSPALTNPKKTFCHVNQHLFCKSQFCSPLKTGKPGHKKL